jgi:hypothetical protein
LGKGPDGSVFAGTFDGRVFQSVGNGPFKLIAAAPERQPDGVVYALEWFGGKLLIGTAAGLYEWSKGYSEPRQVGDYYRCRAILTLDQTTLALGLYGEGIRLLGLFVDPASRRGSEGTRVLCLARDPADPSVILAGLDGGVLLSRDNAASFEELGRFPRYMAVRSLAKKDKDEWYAATERGFFEGSCDGEWKMLQLPAPRFTSLVYFRQKLWIGSDGLGFFVLAKDGSYERIMEALIGR